MYSIYKHLSKDCPQEKAIISSMRNEISKAILLEKHKLLVACRTENVIFLMDYEKKEVIQEYTGHISNIHALLLLNNDTFASADYSGKIKIWNIITGECLSTLENHTRCVSCLLKIENSFFSASYDGEIFKWDLRGNLLNVLERQEGTIFDLVQINKEKFASISTNAKKTITIWNSESCTAVSRIDISKAVHSFYIDLAPHNQLVTVGIKICLWDVDLKEEKIISEMDTEFANGISSVSKISENILAIGSSSGKIFLINLSNMKIINIIDAHINSVSTIIPISDKQLISFGNDGMIIMHQVSTNISSDEIFTEAIEGRNRAAH